MRTDNPWVQSTRLMPENAQLLRGILRHEQAMRTTRRWLSYPQARCSFGFGAEQRPLPVGALLTLWDREPSLICTCNACGGRVLTYAWVAMLNSGQISAVCTGCGLLHAKHIAGLYDAVLHTRPALLGTEFALKGFVFGGSFIGPRLPLWEALTALGETDLPSREWALTLQEPEIRMGPGQPISPPRRETPRKAPRKASRKASRSTTKRTKAPRTPRANGRTS